MPTLAFEAFQAVFLITDLLLLGLVLSAIVLVVRGRRREHYRQAWAQLRSRRLPMVCGGLVMLYGAVGLLDSVHFQLRAYAEGVAQVADDGQPVYEPEVLSLVDLACNRLRQQTEKTFSAPFAIYQFTKETTTDGAGITRRDFPRLEFGGRHLEDPEDRQRDIILLLGRGLGFGLLAAIAIVCVTAGISARRGSRTDAGDWRAGIGSGVAVGLFLGTVTIGLFCVAYLSTRYHILGTDQVGHDVFYRALKGCRVGLVLGTMTTLIATPLAIIYGMAAGYLGGRIDDAVQYVYTTLSSIPSILLIAAVMLIVSTSAASGLTIYAADKRLVLLCFVMGIVGWTGLCRLIRAETLKVRELEYIQAADALGVSAVKIMARHVLPNVTHIVLISMLLNFSGLVLTEAVLAYANIGVHPSMDSWGKMINGARLDISRDPVVWWNLLAAFVFMFGLVLPANIFGDAVRDALDPRLKFEGAKGGSQ